MKSNFYIASLFSILLLQTNTYSQPNLTAIDDTLHFSGDPDLVSVSVTIKNDGDSASLPTYISFYVSLDSAIYSNDSSLIWSMLMDAIEPENILVIDTNINFCGDILLMHLPYQMAFNGQSFNIAYIVDAGDLVNESNESDNFQILTGNVTIICDVGIDDAFGDASFAVYPNPTDGKIHLALPINFINPIGTLENPIGEIVLDNFSLKTNNQLDLSFLPAGMYFLRIQSGQNFLIESILIEK